MPPEITVEELKRRLDAGEPTYLVDVRQPWEHEVAALRDDLLVPLGELLERTGEVAPPPGALVVVYCHHGRRSLAGAAMLEHHGAVSLAGGIEAWSERIDPTMPRY